MAGKVVLNTGATGGIGKAAAIGLARSPPRYRASYRWNTSRSASGSSARE